MDPFAWECPFCNRATTITGENYSGHSWRFSNGSHHGPQFVRLRAITCPNPECKEFELEASLHDQSMTNTGHLYAGPEKKSWALIPPAQTKNFPDYVPRPVLEDYQEACLIRNLSPKASATLARRCLQGIIRDFWGVSKARLVDEIEALKDKVDPITWNAIDAVRNIGNIGAHMERDINVIVDVEPEEAQLLIGLLETLISEWYVARHERERRMRQIVETSQAKKPPKDGTTGSEAG